MSKNQVLCNSKYKFHIPVNKLVTLIVQIIMCQKAWWCVCYTRYSRKGYLALSSTV